MCRPLLEEKDLGQRPLSPLQERIACPVWEHLPEEAGQWDLTQWGVAGRSGRGSKHPFKDPEARDGCPPSNGDSLPTARHHPVSSFLRLQSSEAVPRAQRRPQVGSERLRDLLQLVCDRVKSSSLSPAQMDAATSKWQNNATEESSGAPPGTARESGLCAEGSGEPPMVPELGGK